MTICHTVWATHFHPSFWFEVAGWSGWYPLAVMDEPIHFVRRGVLLALFVQRKTLKAPHTTEQRMHSSVEAGFAGKTHNSNMAPARDVLP